MLLWLVMVLGLGAIGVAAWGVTRSRPFRLWRCTYSTIKAPVCHGVRLQIPGRVRRNRLVHLGLLDVTEKPFCADPTGRRDSTRAIQKAVNFARDHQLVCYFPQGRFCVSDTICCVQNLYWWKKKSRGSARWHPCVLMGSTDPEKRPVIELSPHAPGFEDEENPKYVIHFRTRKQKRTYYPDRVVTQFFPDGESGNISFNQMLIGINLAMGEGNAGAVGIRHCSAQGSGVQDCHIDATHGFKGLEGGCGSGGSHANVHVRGGKIGMDLRDARPAPTLVGVTLEEQTQAPLLYRGGQSLSAAGLKIVFRASGPLINAAMGQKQSPFAGHMCLVDSELSYQGDQPQASVGILAERGLYLRNVYFEHIGTAVEFKGQGKLAGRIQGWRRILELAHASSPVQHPQHPEYTYEFPVYVEGRKSSADVSRWEDVDLPQANLREKHLWGTPFPSWDTPGAANVKAEPYGAAGDGVHDDTHALQQAIDENEVVFLPRGYYLVTKTIRLRPHTKLVGVGQMFSNIIVQTAGETFNNLAHSKPVMETADSAEAQTVLAFCGISVPREVLGAYTLRWMCGRKSVMRSCRVGYHYVLHDQHIRAKHAPRSTPLVVVSGNGGGKWYNYYEEQPIRAPGYRHLLVEGTREPFHVYQCNPEHAYSDANMEIRSACNVYLHGLKSERNSMVLWIRDSTNIHVLGYGGNATAFEGKSNFLIENCSDVSIVNAVDQGRIGGLSYEHVFGIGTDPRRWHMIICRRNGTRVKTAPLERPVLFHIGPS